MNLEGLVPNANFPELGLRWVLLHIGQVPGARIVKEEINGYSSRADKPLLLESLDADINALTGCA